MHDQPTVLSTATGAPLVISSEARAHLEAHPTVWNVLPEAAARLDLPESGLKYSAMVDLGRPLERSGAVETPRIQPTERARFALRTNRAYPSRIIETVPTTWVSTVVIRALRAEATAPFELATAYIGAIGPREPWDPLLMSQADFDVALDFWSRNALVYDPVVMQSPFDATWADILMQAQSPFWGPPA